VLTASLVLSPIVFAQEAPQAIFRSAVEVVTVSAAVRNSKGRVIKDLKAADFEDGDDSSKRRCYLRAWMEVPLEDRRLPIGREFFHMENKDGRLGYDPVPGREGAIARNDYANVDENLAALFRAAQAKPKIG